VLCVVIARFPVSCYRPCKQTLQISPLRTYSTLNTGNLSFPLPENDIPKFESLNPTISVNVLSLDDRDLCVESCSPERDRKHHVSLLLLSQVDKRHYMCVKNMSRLVADRTKHKHGTYVCNGCLHPFSSKHVLDCHTTKCVRNPSQAVKYPYPEDSNFKPTRSSYISRFISSAILNPCP